MRALPTVYDGVTFRSRLEADWACTMDHHHIQWTYEPEGFELDDGTHYLPDFWLPEIRTWLEVKGGHNDRKEKVHAFAEALYRHAQLPEFETTQYGRPLAPFMSRKAPLVLLGGEPTSPFGAGYHRSVYPMGVKPGSGGFSLYLVYCPQCHRLQWVPIGASQCRHCDYETPDAEWPDDDLSPFPTGREFNLEWFPARRPRDDRPYDFWRH